MSRKDIEDRYWSKVDVRGPDECWPWTAFRDWNGYGKFWDGTRDVNGHPHMVIATRWAWKYLIGPISDGLFVLHHCDNPWCMNQKCHFLGTKADNAADCVAKGRSNVGSIHHAARLTETEVLTIRKRHAAGGVYQRELAAEYGVCQVHISMIVLRKTWKHI